MPVIESFYVAMFLISVVFVALFALYLAIKLFSYIFIKTENKRNIGNKSQ